MSFKRHAGTLGLTVLLARSLHPCSIVYVGGMTPTKIQQLSGTVVGDGRQQPLVSSAGKAEWHSITVRSVPAAMISVKIRTDTAFFKKGEVQYPAGMKPSRGNLKEWQCGSEISTAKTDQAGNFTISRLDPGKYCLDITAQPTDKTEILMHESFLIDLVASAPRNTLIADITPRWPDCSGGGSLRFKSVN
jgi:hypothetical protein